MGWVIGPAALLLSASVASHSSGFGNSIGHLRSSLSYFKVSFKHVLLSSWQNLKGLDTHSIVGSPNLPLIDSSDPNAYKLPANSPAKNTGRIGGIPSGAPTDMGAWGNGATSIGANLVYEL